MTETRFQPFLTWVINRAHTFLIAQPQRVNRWIYFPSTSPLSLQDRLLVFVCLISLASKLIHMLKVAIQMPNLDCLLQCELWHFHRYSYFLRKVLAEASKRHPHLVQHSLRCGCCPPWGSFSPTRTGFLSADSGQSSLQDWYSGALGKENQKFPAWFDGLPTEYFTTC